MLLNNSLLVYGYTFFQVSRYRPETGHGGRGRGNKYCIKIISPHMFELFLKYSEFQQKHLIKWNNIQLYSTLRMDVMLYRAL